MTVSECLYSLWMFFHFWIFLIRIFLSCIFPMSNYIFEYSSFEYSYFASLRCLTYHLLWMFSSIYHLLWMFLFHKIFLDISSQHFEWLFLSSFEWSLFGMILSLRIHILQFWNFNWILFSHKIFLMVDQSRLPDWLSFFSHFCILSNTFLYFFEWSVRVVNDSLYTFLTFNNKSLSLS